jgi:hypothetical protein
VFVRTALTGESDPSCPQTAKAAPFGMTGEAGMASFIKTVILKDGMPSVEQARARLNSEIQNARQSGVKVLKVVHGYGSTGVGGDLRFALQATLRQMVTRREIRDCIFGENWRKSDERAWEALQKMPELKNEPDLGRGNRGVTIILL